MDKGLNELIQTYQGLKNDLSIEGSSFVENLENNAESEIDSISEELVQSFEKWKKNIDDSVPFVAVRFYWAGAETEPFIPSAVWSYLYGGDPFQGIVGKAKKVFLKEGPAFEPNSLIALSNGKLEEIPDHLFDLIKDIYVTGSLIFASKALILVKNHPHFLALKPTYPFHFIATPGHDEPPVLLTVFK